MITMYDAATAANIPTNAPVVAGYINGRYKWSAADWARFPGAQHVPIQIYIPGVPVIDDGLVLDIEASDVQRAIQEGAPQRFIDMRKSHGIRPCLYTSKGYYSTLASLNIDTDYWIADPTGVEHLIPTTVATQYRWNVNGYDISCLKDGWPSPTTLVLPPADGTGRDYTDANGYHFVYG